MNSLMLDMAREGLKQPGVRRKVRNYFLLLTSFVLADFASGFALGHWIMR